MTRYVVEKQKVVHNISIIKQHAQNRIIFAVLKNNAYGLGLDMMVRTLLENDITNFAVAEFGEAVRIRQISADAEILFLNPVYSEDELSRLIEERITITISSLNQAKSVNAFCFAKGLTVHAHIEIDTGMGRYGFLEQQLEQILYVYNELSNINITGIYTHVYNSACYKDTKMQINQFSNLLNKLSEKGIQPGIAHLASSVVLFKYPEALFDAVRIGSAFTGRLITKEKYQLEKVGYIESYISDIRYLPKGQNIGYGGVFRTNRSTGVAVVAAGYLQGYCTEKARDLFGFKDVLRCILSDLKNFFIRKKHYVNINGLNAPILGRIGTNYAIVDIKGIECSVGDIVILDAGPMICGNILSVVYI